MRSVRRRAGNLLLLMIPAALCGSSRAGTIVWRELPDLPQALGGQFVGTIGDRLVVAGGSYFRTPPWSGGKKQWVDTVYTLEHGAGHWRLAGHLPTPLGYGVAVSLRDSMLLIGGQTPEGSSAATLRLSLQNGRLEISKLAPLPRAASMFGGARLGDAIFLAGGQAEPSSTESLHDFRRFEGGEWYADPPWPGSPRILPMMAALHGFVYVFGGAELTGVPGPPVGRRFLKDAFRFKPGAGWQRLPDLPHPLQAGLALGWKGRILVFGGNDGSLADREFELKDRHPGFRREVLAFDPKTRQWSKIGEMPLSLVTTGIAVWGDELVIAGGEARPAHRSAKVIGGHLL
jgi:N-acetylneuraminate epimerase